VIRVYLGYNILPTEKQFIRIASLIKEISGKNASAIDITHYNNKAILYSGNNDIDHISEEVLNSLDGQIKISVHSILYRPSGKIFCC
jgi:hypothetical protein